MPPSYSFTALANASIDSMSKWFCKSMVSNENESNANHMSNMKKDCTYRRLIQQKLQVALQNICDMWERRCSRTIYIQSAPGLLTIWGTSRPSLANTTRDFCPSLSSSIFCTCILPETPKRPRYFLRSSRESLGYCSSKNSRGVFSNSKTSTKCCVNLPSFKCPWGRISPNVGWSSPAMSLIKVVLPLSKKSNASESF